jgi:hypothetical protein
MPMPVTPAGTDPPVPVPAPPAANDGPWEPLIPLVLAADDAVAGKWRVEDGKLIVESAEAARLRLPAQPTGSYRVRVTLVRTEGSSTISIILPVGDRSVRLMLSGFGGLLSGLGVIDGKIASENDTTVTMTAANRMENNKPQTIVATVRLAADGGAAGGDRVDIDLNGQPLIKWTGNRQSLSVQDAWRMRATGPSGIGVGAHLSQVRFEAVEVQVIDGELTRLRP